MSSLRSSLARFIHPSIPSSNGPSSPSSLPPCPPSSVYVPLVFSTSYHCLPTCPHPHPFLPHFSLPQTSHAYLGAREPRVYYRFCRGALPQPLRQLVPSLLQQLVRSAVPRICQDGVSKSITPSKRIAAACTEEDSTQIDRLLCTRKIGYAFETG